jgi:hypothetical protein
MTQKKGGRDKLLIYTGRLERQPPLLIITTAKQARKATYPKRLNGRRRTLAIHQERAPAAEEPRPSVAIGKKVIELKLALP